MENSQKEVFKDSELSLDELQAVIGGNRTGASLALTGTLIGVAAGVLTGGIGGVLAIAGSAYLGLGYAYDAYSSSAGGGSF